MEREREKMKEWEKKEKRTNITNGRRKRRRRRVLENILEEKTGGGIQMTKSGTKSVKIQRNLSRSMI